MLGNPGIWAQKKKIWHCLEPCGLVMFHFFPGGCRNDSGQNY